MPTLLRASNDPLIADLINDPAFVISPDGKIYRKGEEVGRVDKDGYREVWYKGKRLKAHRIVYAKFCGRLRSDMVVDHKDRNPGNNSPTNLQLCTCKTNNVYRHKRKEADDERHTRTPIQADQDQQRLPAEQMGDDCALEEVAS